MISGAIHSGRHCSPFFYKDDRLLKLKYKSCNQSLKSSGEKLVHEGKGQAIYSFKQYPAENTKYKVVTDAYRNAERWNTSSHTHTEWTFWSKQQEE